MKKTRLYDVHVELGGRMVDFAGWNLPVQYSSGPLAEHQAVRTAAGLFDIDHMGQFEIRGPDAELFLQFIQVRDISELSEMEAAYSLMTYGDGTIVDDIFLYRLPGRWFVVVNAANRKKDFDWMQYHSHDFDITIADISDETYMLALQGPKAETILQRLTKTDLSVMQTRTSAHMHIGNTHGLVGRTGYTGEDGFELYIPDEDAVATWRQILDAGKTEGLLPCGLAARDSLRFEACMALYGHEIDATTTPLEARLGWVVSWNKDFIGRTALLKSKLEQPYRLLVGFEMVERSVPREGYSIAVDGKIAGYVTTGMKSPTLEKFLGLGYVPAAHSKLGTEIDIVIRDQPKRARIIKRPFYKPQYR